MGFLSYDPQTCWSEKYIFHFVGNLALGYLVYINACLQNHIKLNCVGQFSGWVHNKVYHMTNGVLVKLFIRLENIEKRYTPNWEALLRLIEKVHAVGRPNSHKSNIEMKVELPLLPSWLERWGKSSVRNSLSLSMKRKQIGIRHGR